ncbi:MAG: hypothetical protein ACKVOB_07695, partial [Sphingomonas sp.]
PLPIALPLSNLFYCARGRSVAAHGAPQFSTPEVDWSVHGVSEIFTRVIGVLQIRKRVGGSWGSRTGSLWRR